MYDIHIRPVGWWETKAKNVYAQKPFLSYYFFSVRISIGVSSSNPPNVYIFADVMFICSTIRCFSNILFLLLNVVVVVVVCGSILFSLYNRI